MKIEYKISKSISKESIKSLYEDAEWSAYTKDMDKLYRAIQNSDIVITAWEGEKLLGLIRTISDRETILYIQDVLVLKDYKRMGIGKELMNRILNSYTDIRQILLITDTQDEVSNSFYESINFKVSKKEKTTLYYKNRIN